MRNEECVKNAQDGRRDGQRGIEGRGAPRYPRWNELEMFKEHEEGLWGGSVVGGWGDMNLERWADPEHAARSPRMSLKHCLDRNVERGHERGMLVQGRDDDGHASKDRQETGIEPQVRDGMAGTC